MLSIGGGGGPGAKVEEEWWVWGRLSNHRVLHDIGVGDANPCPTTATRRHLDSAVANHLWANIE